MLVKVGARSSQLSVAQTGLVLNALNPFVKTELKTMLTSGDLRSRGELGGAADKKECIYEIEQALLRKEIDLAVHSGKDVPVDIDPATKLSAVLLRENPADVFIGKLNPASGQRLKFAELPSGAVIGTTSLRRRAQLARLRPDLFFIELRGNVQTRLRKLDQEQHCDGIVLAAAGLKRLELHGFAEEVFGFEQMLPGVNQGILVVQYLRDSVDVERVIAKLREQNTYSAWLAERSCVEVLEADCRSSLGVFAQVKQDQITLDCRVLSSDGSQSIEVSDQGVLSQAIELGQKVAKQCLEKGARGLLQS